MSDYFRITNEFLEKVRSDRGLQLYRKKPISIEAYQMNVDFEVETLEGLMKGHAGDYLIVGVDQELYPCHEEIFKKTYDYIE